MRISPTATAWLLLGMCGVACGNAAPEAKAPDGEVSVVVPTASADPETAPASADTAAADSPETPRKPPKQADPAPTAAPVALPPVTGPTAASGGTATVVSSSSAPNTELQALAASDAAGMTAAGATLAARFKTGETLEFQLTLSPGRCYTVLAAGAASVQQIDLQMGISPASLPIPMPAAVLAQATGTKTAVIGAKSSGCYKNPMPIPFPATVTMKVAAGSGIAGVQVYAK